KYRCTGTPRRRNDLHGSHAHERPRWYARTRRENRNRARRAHLDSVGTHPDHPYHQGIQDRRHCCLRQGGMDGMLERGIRSRTGSQAPPGRTHCRLKTAVNVRKESAMNDILEQVSRATAPEKMGPREALEFIEELMGELEIRAEALRQDLDKE